MSLAEFTLGHSGQEMGECAHVGKTADTGGNKKSEKKDRHNKRSTARFYPNWRLYNCRSAPGCHHLTAWADCPEVVQYMEDMAMRRGRRGGEFRGWVRTG